MNFTIECEFTAVKTSTKARALYEYVSGKVCIYFFNLTQAAVLGTPIRVGGRMEGAIDPTAECCGGHFAPRDLPCGRRLSASADSSHQRSSPHQDYTVAMGTLIGKILSQYENDEASSSSYTVKFSNRKIWSRYLIKNTIRY